MAALTKRYEAAIPWLTLAGIAIAVAIGVVATLRRRASRDRVDAAPTPPAIADSDPATGFGKP